MATFYRKDTLTAYHPETAPAASPSKIEATAPRSRSQDSRSAPFTPALGGPMMPDGVRMPTGREPGCVLGLLKAMVGR